MDCGGGGASLFSPSSDGAAMEACGLVKNPTFDLNVLFWHTYSLNSEKCGILGVSVPLLSLIGFSLQLGFWVC